MIRSLRVRFFLVVWPLVVAAVVGVGWYFGSSTRTAIHREMRVAASFDIEDLALGDSVTVMLQAVPAPEPDELLIGLMGLAEVAATAGFPEPRIVIVDAQGRLEATTDPELEHATYVLDEDVLHLHREIDDRGNIEMRMRGEDVDLPEGFRFVDGVDPVEPVRLYVIPSPSIDFRENGASVQLGVEDDVTRLPFDDDAFNETIDQFQPDEFLDRTNRTILTGVLLASVIAALATLLVARPVVGRAGRLATAARQIREGDLATRVPATPGDELGEVEAAFNEMAETLESTEELKRRMVSDAAHELRTPLTNLVGTLEAVEDGLREADRPTMASLREEVGLLERLVEDLQEIAVADAGALELDIRDVDLLVETEGAMRAIGATAEAADVKIHLQGDGVPAHFVKKNADTSYVVRADQRRLAQVLRNLLRNAVTHSPAGSEVRVRISSRGQNLDVAIEDQGPGIAAKHLDLIWERFYRVEDARDRKTGGMGLGLAIVKRLVEAQGGRVWAESRAGEGATFHFTLPAVMSAD